VQRIGQPQRPQLRSAGLESGYNPRDQHRP
jgi:hypothetical protein